MRSKLRMALSWFLLAWLLAGCGGTKAPPIESLPASEVPAGWTRSGETQTFDEENLYDLVDGQAESFFAYAFESVTVQTYEGPDGAILRVEIWQLSTPADAYGLFTTYRAGTPIAIGQEGDTDLGRRLDFWQGRHFVRLFAPEPIPEADMQALAESIASTLPAGGEPPSLLAHLPQQGLVARSDIFFHQEISLQSYLWLGGENLLGLGTDTEGILARYDLDGASAQLLLVRYADAGAASAALEALQAAQIDNLVTAQTGGNLLAAVLGSMDGSRATRLVEGALGHD
jgi:hypothetical protein